MNSLALHMAAPPLQVTKPRWPKLGRITPVGLSLLIHGAFFIYFGANLFDNGDRKMQYGPISVHLQPAPEPPRAIPPSPPAPRPTSIKPVSPTPMASVKPQALTPSVERVEVPIEAPVEESDPQTETQDATPPAMTPVAATTPTQPTTEPSIKERQQAKQHYLATLMARIEAHKHYPHAARQRHMEGLTTVRFTLLASGKMREINISGGPKLLRLASKAALQKALPLPAPPDTINFPLTIQFNMEYRLI